MKTFDYIGERQNAISFPLGGIGTGCIGLGGDGRLIDWEIFNRPNKDGLNGYSHFALRCEADGETIDVRILQGDLKALGEGTYVGTGFGPSRQLLADLPHFQTTTFSAAYPFAQVGFADPSCPCEVKLTAFNPLIPLNDFDSGIPAAFFEYEVVNRTDRHLTCMLAGTLGDPLPEQQIHQQGTSGRLNWLHFGTNGVPSDDPKWGDLTLATDAPRVSAQAYGFRGGWFDDLEILMRDLRTPGPLQARHYPPDQAGAGNHGTLAAHFDLAPRAGTRVRFLIAWHFPNCENFWNKSAAAAADAAGIPGRWKNYYATCWPEGSRQSAAYAFAHWNRLEADSRRYHADLYGLGDIFAAPRVKSALGAIFKLNFASPLRNHVNPCRIYGLNDESGLTICSWPNGRRPVIPIPYAQECMHGFEYAAAALMISRGLIDEALRSISASPGWILDILRSCQGA